MRRTIAALLLACLVAFPLAAQQQWGSWVQGRAGFGDWHWASPVANLTALNLVTGSPGQCIALMDTGAVYCWSGDSSAWVAQGGGGGGSIGLKESGSSVDAATTILDFGDGFDLLSSPAGTVALSLDLSELNPVDLLLTAQGHAWLHGGDSAIDLTPSVTSLSSSNPVGPSQVDIAAFSDTTNNAVHIKSSGETDIGNFSLLGNTISDNESIVVESNALGTGAGAFTLNVHGTGGDRTLTFADTGVLTAPAFAGPLTGNVTGNVTGSSGSTTGNAATATLATTATTANGVAANSVALGTDTTGGYAASSSEGGAASSVAANSVALGTDTTGGYAASATEGGPATTATALAANGANCSASSFPLGVDASGAVESCSTSISGNAATATALAADGANCSAGNYPLGVDASGAVQTCTAAPAAFAAAGSGSEIQVRASSTTVAAVTGSSSANGGVALVNQSAGAIPLSVTAAASQSGNMINITTNGGTAGDLFKIASDGSVTLGGTFVKLSRNGSGEWDMNKGGSGDYGSFYFQTAGTTKYKLQHDPSDNWIVGREGGNTLTFSASAPPAFSGAATIGDILKITPKATAPATCTAATDIYTDTSGALCFCSATNTWTNVSLVGACV